MKRSKDFGTSIIGFKLKNLPFKIRNYRLPLALESKINPFAFSPSFPRIRLPSVVRNKTMDKPLKESSDLPDFQNWEIPLLEECPVDPVKAHEEWLADWRARVASGELTLEILRNRQQPVPVPFEM